MRLCSTLNTFLYTNLLIYVDFGWEFFYTSVRQFIEVLLLLHLYIKQRFTPIFSIPRFYFASENSLYSISQWIWNLRTLLRWQFVIYSLRACESFRIFWTVAEAVSEVDFYLSYWKNEISSTRRGKYFTLKLKLVCCHVRVRFLYHFQYKTRVERKEKGELWVGEKNHYTFMSFLRSKWRVALGVEAESMLVEKEIQIEKKVIW